MKTKPPYPDEVLARFWSRVDVRGKDDCWPWLGGHHGVTGRKYGAFQPTKGDFHSAHSFAWEAANGPMPVGKPFACHNCDNTECCNPAHIWPGTSAENTADKVAKGRQTKGDDTVWRKYPEKKTRIQGESSNFSKLREGDVRGIRRRLEAGERQCDIARELRVDRHTIYKIGAGKSWTHLI